MLASPFQDMQKLKKQHQKTPPYEMMQSVRKTGGISMMKAAIVFGVLVVLAAALVAGRYSLTQLRRAL
jgi:hypothetical protein